MKPPSHLQSLKLTLTSFNFFLQSQDHRPREKNEEFESRYQELNVLTQLMDSDGVRQIKYQILNNTVLPSHKHILVKLFLNKTAA